MNNVYSLEVVARGSETQLQVGKKTIIEKGYFFIN